jgi:uncharacterized protein
MRLVAELLQLSATDLANHLGCAHLSGLDLAVAERRAERPRRHDPILELLTQRGREHEAAYLQHLRAQKLTVAEIHTAPGTDSVDTTLAAMRDGVDVIYQAPLADERWHGRADFLRKVPRPCKLGEWSYEVVDAKLATQTRAGTILQLCVYSSLLEKLQGERPHEAHVVAPHRLPSFSANTLPEMWRSSGLVSIGRDQTCSRNACVSMDVHHALVPTRMARGKRRAADKGRHGQCVSSQIA